MTEITVTYAKDGKIETSELEYESKTDALICFLDVMNSLESQGYYIIRASAKEVILTYKSKPNGNK